MQLKVWSTIFCLLGSYFLLKSQEPNFISYTSENGLPSSTIYRVAEDHDGFLWFTSPMGLSQFDGKRFKNYTTDDGLPDNEILHHYVDSQNRIWLAAFSGDLAYYQDGKFYNPGNTPFLKEASSNSFAYVFREDKEGKIWVGTREDGLVLIDGEEVYRFPKEDSSQIARATYIGEFGDSIFVMGFNIGNPEHYPILFGQNKRFQTRFFEENSGGGVGFLNHDYSYRTILPSQFGSIVWDSLPFNEEVRLIYTDSGGNLWVATSREGILFYAKTENGFQTPPKHYLKNNTVGDLEEDFQGGIWITTLDEGVFHVPNRKVLTYNQKNTPGFPPLQDQRTFAYQDSTIYFSDGHGKIFSLKDGRTELVASTPERTYAYPRGLIIHKGWLWIGTDRGVHAYQLDDKAEAPVSSISIYIDRRLDAVQEKVSGPYLYINLSAIKCVSVLANGNLLFGTSIGLYELTLRKYPGEEIKEPLKKIGPGWLSTAYQNVDGNVWYGTRTGVYMYNGETAMKVAWLNEKIPTQINHITGFEDGSLVFSSNGNGIFILQGKEVTQITTQDGLSSNICSEAFIDEENNIWVGTNRGLNRIRFQDARRMDFSIAALTIFDGLGENTVSSIRIEDGTVIAATNHGFSMFDIEEADNPRVRPHITISAVRIQSEAMDLLPRYEIPWSDRKVEVDFSAITFKDPDHIVYGYRWLEQDTNWSTTMLPGIQINALPSGMNTLEVRAQTREGGWSNEPATLQIYVSPAIWQRWWFVPMCLLALGLLVYLYTRYRTLKLQKSRKELSREVLARTRELETANEEVLKQKEKAEAADLAKSEFLATMSHEIRTPLNGVIGLTELLIQSRLDKQQLSLAENIQLSGKMLLSLINDILDFSKIEAGKLEIEAEPVMVRDCLKQVVQMQFMEADGKGLEIKAMVGDDIPGAVLGDEVRIGQILINLLGNAIKFTEKGGIYLDVRRKPEVDRDGKIGLEFSVRDTGIGIAEEKIGNLFQRFQQVDTSTTRKYGGSGLGLAICARLCKMMGGDISVTSVLGQGSTFRFYILVAPTEAPAVETILSQSSTTTRKLDGLNILVADDNPINLAVASGMLAKLGCKLDTVENGREAVEALAKKSYQLVLMDLQMPEMDGLEATRQILHIHPEGSRPPIVAMTANAFAEQRQACEAAGMNGFIAKPFTMDQLREVIMKTLDNSGFAGKEEGLESEIGEEEAVSGEDQGLSGKNKGLSGKEKGLSGKDKVFQGKDKGPSGESALFDLSTLMEMSPDDPGFMIIILQKTLKSLESGRLGLPEDLEKNDLKAVSALAHKLKSTAVNIGASQLADILRKLEHAAREGSQTARISELVKDGVEAIGRLVPGLSDELDKLTEN